MAEVVGVAASVAQLVHLSGTLLAGGYGFLTKVARGPNEIRGLLTEAAAVNSLLSQLQLIADAPSDPSTEQALSSLARLGVLQECKTLLEFIELALARCEQEAGKDFQNFGKRLKWPFKEKETKDALQRLHQLRGVLANAVEVDSANTLRRIETGQVLLVDGMRSLSTKVETQMSREESQKVLSWLCPLPTTGAHVSLENALARRPSGTGEWFLQSKIFTHWLVSKNSAETSSTWITGLPGSGKTLLCASAIQKLLTLQTERNEDMTILYFFCDHRDPAKVTHDSFLMTLTKQILNHSPDFMEQAKKIYDEKANNGERMFNRTDYISLIQSFMSLCKHVFIFCDALDESSEGDEIANSLGNLFEYGQKCDVSTRVLMTSRFDVQLERRHATLTTNRVALAENMKPDIDQYVTTEVGSRVEKGTLKMRDKNLQSSIQEQVASRAGTILHARMQLDYFSTARNDKDLKAMITNLPNGLEHTYETILSHMTSTYPDRVENMKILLQCLVVASPTLTASDLAEILAMGPEQAFLDFDLVSTDPYDELEVIAPLVVLTKIRKTHGIVKLAHYSLDEYLSSPRILQSQARQFHVNPEEANVWLASICLQYLTFDIFNLSRYQKSKSDFPSLEQYSFRRYAALNWFRHYQQAKRTAGFSEQCKPYLDRLFSDEDGSPSFKHWRWIYQQEYPYDESPRYSPVCFAISQGLDDIVEDLLPRLSDINIPQTDGYTCLNIAAKWNRPTTIRKLLALGADINEPGSRQSTPLHLAAEFASRDACDVLLDAGADSNARSLSGSTAFYRACRGGDVHIVQRLKDCGSDINAQTSDSWTPIMEAVENGHEAVVDLLLGWGADLSVKTRQKWTVLLVAEDGFNLAPNRRIIEKLKRAVGREAYRDSVNEVVLEEKAMGEEDAVGIEIEKTTYEGVELTRQRNTLASIPSWVPGVIRLPNV
ncbi:hypothetical protein HBI24_158410 [Parastagonospora nodorum]|nr:hypothetical protein HBH42_056210 [Parastagonospora nodorum]KAH5409465.1 hypothetical protein HBI46_174470 [Parastagonospora nodorum]KAH5578831.1 hypothetical protein HBI24_158410 [Parastagonospora nodorum]KAH6067882.1 hypothetical protein HBI66_147360 [Parastagonospora nodorum]KAH6077357.1 hypothetical protein HBI67_042700 [Parastagonospora nodorum]